MPDTLRVSIEGPDKSGKGYAMAAIAHYLESLGCEVVVQLGETHNAKKLAKSDPEIAERLKGVKVILTEMQT
jgi:K+-sensing histidine kinase KdpD